MSCCRNSRAMYRMIKQRRYVDERERICIQKFPTIRAESPAQHNPQRMENNYTDKMPHGDR